jgi:multiple sugar transport system substrate-binding protein/sn-glycerol 3-phosphate transport system substrate-binding protein
MAFLKQLLDDGCAYFFTEGFPNPEFAARRAIFTQGSSSGIPFYAGDLATVAEEAGREVDEWGVAAIPHTTADPVQNIYGGDVMITSTTPEQQLAAWLFVKWFTSPEIQQEWAIISGYFPTRQSTSDLLADYKEENPQWGQAVDMLPYSYYEPQLISYQSVRDAAQAAFNQIMQLPEGWTVEDIQGVLAELTATTNELQEELMAEIQ